MYVQETATADQRRQCPYRFDRIEVQVKAFTTPAAVNHGIHVALDRPTEPLAFCILGAFHCYKADGPDIGMLTVLAASIAGVGGWFGFTGARRLRSRRIRGAGRAGRVPGSEGVSLDGATTGEADAQAHSTTRLDCRRSARRPYPTFSNRCEAFMPTFTFNLTFQADVADRSAAHDLGAAAVAHMQETFNDDGSLDGWRITARRIPPGSESVQTPGDTDLPAV